MRFGEDGVRQRGTSRTALSQRQAQSPASERPATVDLERVPWSRYSPTPWRGVQTLQIALACDGEDAPKPLVEGLTRDGHRAFWSSRDRLISRLRLQRASGGSRIDVVIVSARLLAGVEGLDLLATIHEKCAGASLLLLGSETPEKAALTTGLRKSGAFQQVLTLGSPADVDDLRMMLMNVSASCAQSGFQARVR